MAVLPSLPRKHKAPLAIGLACLIALITFAIYGEHGLRHLQRLRQHQASLEEMAFQLQQNNERMQQHIWKLQHDDRYLERLARERLGMVRPGEITYRLRPAPQTHR